MPNIIINAMNIHAGGGGVLLRALLAQLPANRVILLHDKRFSPPNAPNLKAVAVPPSFSQRLKMERNLVHLAEKGDTLFCFGNQPPLFKSKAKVVLYLHNALLVNDFPLSEFPKRARIRNTLAKWLLKGFIKNVDQIWVQTLTMVNWTQQKFPQLPTEVKFFLPEITLPIHAASPSYDFIYIAHLEPHKNHRTLIEAWVELAKQGIRPSLLLNVANESDQPLFKWIKQQISQYDLKLEFIEPTTHENILKYYSQTQSLIYPSLCESLGLPLLEASQIGLPILASDLSFVHDIVQPYATFDPNSADSIAIAVNNFLNNSIRSTTNVTSNPIEPISIKQVWQALLPR